MSNPCLAKNVLVQQTEVQKLQTIDQAKDKLLQIIKKQYDKPEEVKKAAEQYLACFLSYKQLYEKINSDKSLIKKHFKKELAPKFKVESNFTKKSLSYVNPEFEIYYLLFVEIICSINSYVNLTSQTATVTKLGSIRNDLKKSLGMFNQLRDFSRQITPTSKETDIALETKTELIDMCESLCRALIFMCGAETGLLINMENKEGQHYNEKDLADLVYSAQLSFEEVQNRLDYDLKNDKKQMKQELLDFVAFMYQFCILLKNALCFDVLYDKIMDQSQQLDNDEYQSTKKEMIAYASQVRYEMTKYQRLFNIGSVGMWGQERFKGFNQIFNTVQGYSQLSQKQEQPENLSQKDIPVVEWQLPTSTLGEILRQPYLEAELLSYEDPLSFEPQEPRYKLVNLIMQDMLQNQSFNCCDVGKQYVCLGLINGQIRVIAPQQNMVVADIKPNEEEQTPISCLQIVDEQQDCLIIASSIKGCLYLSYIQFDFNSDIQTQDYTVQLIMSQGQDIITHISSVIQNQTNILIYFSTNQGQLYCFNTKSMDCQTIYNTAFCNQQPIIALTSSQEYTAFLNGYELIVIKNDKKQQILTQKTQRKNINFASLQFCDNILLVSYNDEVIVFQLPQYEYPYTQSLSVMINAATQNMNIIAENSLQQLDNKFEVPQQAKDIKDIGQIAQQLNYQYFERKPIQSARQISRFQIQDPQVTILQILPCGEGLAILSLNNNDIKQQENQEQNQDTQSQDTQSEESSQQSYETNGNNFSDPFFDYNEQDYEIQEVEESNSLIHLHLMDIEGNEIHGAVLPIVNTGYQSFINDRFITPLTCFKQVSSSLLELPTYVLSTNSLILQLKPSTSSDHVNYLLNKEKYSQAVRSAILLRPMDEDWKNCLAFCHNQVQAGNEIIKTLNDEGINSLLLKQKYYSDCMYHTYKENNNFEKLYNMRLKRKQEQEKREKIQQEMQQTNEQSQYEYTYQSEQYMNQQEQTDDEEQSLQEQSDESSQTEETQQIHLAKVEEHFGIKQLIFQIIQQFLDQQKVKNAQQLLDIFISPNDRMWQSIVSQFGTKENFTSIIPMLPQMEKQFLTYIIGLSLSHNYDSFTQLLIKFKENAFPDECGVILTALSNLKDTNPDVAAANSIIELYQGEYTESLEHLAQASTYQIKSAQIYKQFVSKFMKNQIEITPKIKQILIKNADVLFSLDSELSVRIFTKLIQSQQDMQDVFLEMLVLILKQSQGLQANQPLTKSTFSNDSRIIKTYLQANCSYYFIESQKQQVQTSKTLIQLFDIIYSIAQNVSSNLLDCLNDSSFTLSDWLLTLAAPLHPELFTSLIQNYSQNANFLNTISLCRDYSTVDTMLEYVLQQQGQLASQTNTTQQIQLYQQAVQQSLKNYQADQAIMFIRRLFDSAQSNPQQLLVVKQANLWGILTTTLIQQRNSNELIDLMVKETLPVDINQVIDKVLIEEDESNNQQQNNSIYKLINNLRLINQLQLSCAELVKQDVSKLRYQLVNNVLQKGITANCICDKCNQKIQPYLVQQGQIYDPEIEKQLQEEKMVIFNCGHVFHQKCLQQSNDEEAYCPICVGIIQ